MKTIILKTVLLSALTAVLFGCGTSSGEAESPQQKNALIIIKDLSGSVQQDSVEVQKEFQWIRSYLMDHREPQDILLLSLTDASVSAVNCLTFEWKQDPKQEEEGYVSETDKMLKEQSEKSSDRSQSKKLEAMLFKSLLDLDRKERSAETHIIEIMPQIDRIMKRGYGSADVLILSDGIQESGLRSFSKHPPATKQEAEAMASADSKKMRSSFTLGENVLEKTRSVTVLVPASSKRKDLTIVPYYYTTYFAAFGFRSDIRWHSLDF